MGFGPEDDRRHPPAEPHPWWTETCWFSFGQPETRLSGTFYPLLRPNLGVAGLGVAVWDDTACEPWRVPYHRAHWHLPLPPQAELDAFALGGLRYDVLEPLHRYRVRYEDGELLRADLEVTGLLPPHDPGSRDGRGHLDQPCRVAGEVVLHGRRHAIDCFDMRDRSWQVRSDDRSTRGSYSYAIASAHDAFLAIGFHLEGEDRVVAGFLVRDGEKADLREGVRRVERSPAGWPARVRIEARDTRGRELAATGRTLNRLASQASPGLFAWMSLTAWDFAGASHGQDQDIWSPDLLAGRPFGPESR